MNKKKKVIIILVIFAVIGALVGMAIVNNKNKDDGSGLPKDAPTVQTESAKVEKIVSTVKADGEVKFKESTILYASTSAEIKNVLVEEGDQVTQGQTLIEYDQDALDSLKNQLEDAKLDLKSSQLSLEALQIPPDEAEIKQAQAEINVAEKRIEELDFQLKQYEIDIKQAESDISVSQKDYDNSKILYEQGVISLDEFNKSEKDLNDKKNTLEKAKSTYQNELLSMDTAKESLEVSKIKYDSLINKNKQKTNLNLIESRKVDIQQRQQKIKQLQNDINKFKLKEVAPVTGTVVSLKAEVGETPAESKELLEIADINNMIIMAEIPEYDMADIKVGQDALIKGDALAEQFNGKISKIYPVANKKNETGSTKTVVNVEITAKTNQNLRSGYTVDTEITTNISENAVVVPIMSYITEKNDAAFVYIVNSENKIEKRPIVLKAYADLYVEVDGVKEGEQVVSNPDGMIQEGMIVRTMNSEIQSNTDEQTTENTTDESESDKESTTDAEA